MRFRTFCIAAGLCGIWTGAARAQGGPPMLTDDPGTPGNGRWEISLALTGDVTHDTGTYGAPVADVNYGPGEHWELTLEVPWSFEHSVGGGTNGDLGEVETGVKWRFADEGDFSPADVSTYPQLIVHPRLSGPQEEGTELVLPVEIAREVAPFSLNVDVGRIFQRHEGARWFWGTAFQFEPSERTQWVAEFHAETGGDDPARFVNFGLRRDLDPHRLLLLSLGRRVFLEGAPHETIAYVGLQIHG